MLNANMQGRNDNNIDKPLKIPDPKTKEKKSNQKTHNYFKNSLILHLLIKPLYFLAHVVTVYYFIR